MVSQHMTAPPVRWGKHFRRENPEPRVHASDHAHNHNSFLLSGILINQPKRKWLFLGTLYIWQTGVLVYQHELRFAYCNYFPYERMVCATDWCFAGSVCLICLGALHFVVYSSILEIVFTEITILGLTSFATFNFYNNYFQALITKVNTLLKSNSIAV